MNELNETQKNALQFLLGALKRDQAILKALINICEPKDSDTMGVIDLKIQMVRIIKDGLVDLNDSVPVTIQ